MKGKDSSQCAEYKVWNREGCEMEKEMGYHSEKCMSLMYYHCQRKDNRDEEYCKDMDMMPGSGSGSGSMSGSGSGSGSMSGSGSGSGSWSMSDSSSDESKDEDYCLDPESHNCL